LKRQPFAESILLITAKFHGKSYLPTGRQAAESPAAEARKQWLCFPNQNN
jgi:hypothetical protein